MKKIKKIKKVNATKTSSVVDQNPNSTSFFISVMADVKNREIQRNDEFLNACAKWLPRNK